MTITFRGVTLVTMDSKFRVLQDAAMVIEGSQIAWLGSESDLPLSYQESPTQNLQGRVIFPGFVNLHTHASLVVLRGIGDDLGVAPAYSAKVPQGVFLSPNDCYAFSLLGGIEALRFGTTCIVDNYIHEHQAARAFEQLGIRAVVSERLHDADLFQILDGRYIFDERLGAELLERNLDLIETWEGAGQGRIHTRLGPHAPDTCSTAYLQQIHRSMETTGKGIVIHLAQSQREVAEIHSRSGKRVTEYLDGLGLLGPNTIAGHCIFINEEEEQLLAKTGTHVSHQSGSNAKGGMMAPITNLLARGINIGLGTDNMAGDMVEVMRMAVCTARMRSADNQALRAKDVVEMATIGGARALGMENEIGSLEVGKRADLVVIDFRSPHLIPLIDPVMNLVHNGLGSDVEMVLVDGEIIYSNGSSTRIDERAACIEAQNRTEALWKKFG